MRKSGLCKSSACPKLKTMKGAKMATIEIQNAKVERLIVGYGFKASETTLVKGEERKTWFTVWTKETVKEGDVIDISGELSVKLEEFTGRDNMPKKVAAIHINNAMVMTSQDAPF